MNEVSIIVPGLFLVDSSEFAYLCMSSKHVFELKLVIFIKLNVKQSWKWKYYPLGRELR